MSSPSLAVRPGSDRTLLDPFLATLIATVILASLLPARGRAADITSFVATASVMLLFFLHGARLARDSLVAALRHLRLHATILSITFVLFPILGLVIAAALRGLLPANLWTGVLFLCALPSTVQSSIAFTSIARGNVAGAVTSAAASNLVGIVATPLLIGLITQARGGSVSLADIWKICEQLLVPFAAGHLLRPWIGGWVGRKKDLLSFTDRGTVILSVYSAFSAAVVEGIWAQVPMRSLAVLLAVCALLLAAVLLLGRQLARLLKFSTEDEISIVFCGSKKSLVSGVPMARVLFPASTVGAVVVPIMIFHQMQLMVCAWLARRYGARLGGPHTEEH